MSRHLIDKIRLSVLSEHVEMSVVYGTTLDEGALADTVIGLLYYKERKEIGNDYN